MAPAKIHPTAIIDPAAVIADDVEIGPYAIIGSEVELAAGCVVGPHAVLRGPTRIGAGTRVFQFASVGEDPQDKKYAGERTSLVIGARNVIREYATVHRGTAQDKGETRIGDDNLLMAYTHVAHDCVIGNNVIMANAASLGGHVEVQDWAILGGFTIVHQFCRIGAHSFSAMGTVIAKDVPPYLTIGGHPAQPRGINAEGLRRRQFAAEAIAALRRAYRLLYLSQLKLVDAVAQIHELAKTYPELTPLADFVADSSRSIVR
ncbi:acyl-ACP--UDP-N-acetylglucosamine O-acyltransferase [uncultured Thiohalocapsa sp.]|uniref:acyl-ACP--UDP-N-acetylglucosamine O-acyltransferase n=1 Tax=uncultured Thiohalocapsa sp. TaxID=768990 RepID=UPI0025E9C144|nr:acyl-ACP--UDP-N-acetylglucosamine O-acyltransferase [uncultured Thiohalocapsa sp.]